MSLIFLSLEICVSTFGEGNCQPDTQCLAQNACAAVRKTEFLSVAAGNRLDEGDNDEIGIKSASFLEAQEFFRQRHICLLLV
jgi:positive regulator of sigma E activity